MWLVLLVCRVKYGVLNIVKDPNGVACCSGYVRSPALPASIRTLTLSWPPILTLALFLPGVRDQGDSYLLLKSERVRLRATFASQGADHSPCMAVFPARS